MTHSPLITQKARESVLLLFRVYEIIPILNYTIFNHKITDLYCVGFLCIIVNTFIKGGNYMGYTVHGLEKSRRLGFRPNNIFSLLLKEFL